MDAALSKFIDFYRPLIREDQLHILFKIANDPTIQAAFQKCKQPVKKTVEKLFKQSGISLNLGDVQDEEALGKEVVVTKTTDTNKNFEKSVLVTQQKILSVLETLSNAVSNNIDFAIPSSELSTDVFLSPEDRIAFLEKRRKANNLASRCKEDYLGISKMFSEGGEGDIRYNFFDPLFKIFLKAIDVSQDSFIKYFSFNSPNDIFESKIKLVFWDDVEDSNPIYKQILGIRQDTIAYRGVDPILLIVIKSGTRGVVTYSFTAYMDTYEILKQFDAQDMSRHENHISISRSVDIFKPTPSIFKESFATFFLDLCKDFYTHVYCALTHNNPSYSHDAVFSNAYRLLFE